MIWIDSSFAVEWLLGTDRAKKISLPKEALGILPMQYGETLVFFLRNGHEAVQIVNQLEALELFQPQKIHLQRASFLYLQARYRKSKASLSDAILSAVCQERGGKILSFDQDFKFLEMREAQPGIFVAS